MSRFLLSVAQFSLKGKKKKKKQEQPNLLYAACVTDFDGWYIVNSTGLNVIQDCQFAVVYIEWLFLI